MPDTARQLREKAQKYRMLARSVADAKTVQNILALTDELDHRATLLDWPAEERIRARARELWEKAGNPPDRDDEFWFRAENCLLDETRRNQNN